MDEPTLIRVGESVTFNVAHLVRVWWSDDGVLQVELRSQLAPLVFRDETAHRVWAAINKHAVSA